MASLPSELSLECKPQQSLSMLMKSVGEQSDHAQKLEEFLSRLEEERLKVDAFKRELPLCMQLLSNAVEASRQQLQAYRANQHHEAKPVLEEFIPLKAASSNKATDTVMPTKMPANNPSDKSNWMTSAQLWSQTGDVNKQKPVNNTDSGYVVNKPIRNGGAFLPFTKERNGSRSAPSAGGAAATILPDLSLASSDNGTEDKKYDSGDEGNGGSNINRISATKVERIPSVLLSGGGANHNLNSSSNNHGSSNMDTGGTAGNNQTNRKARRCWSPDLHRRFVSALQMLGGSQVATPKQIRELMKVDGLTNDEVKSHLQKYRLHTRRPSPSPQTGAAAPPQLVVLGGIWVSPEYAAAAAAHGTAPGIYGVHPSAHVAPPHYRPPPAVSQEFYAQPPPPPTATHHEVIHHHRHHQQQLHGASQARGSPERGRSGDRSESIEDGKSESSSWKGGESGCEGEDNNGGCGGSEGKARDDNEMESNGSQIKLKF